MWNNSGEIINSKGLDSSAAEQEDNMDKTIIIYRISGSFRSMDRRPAISVRSTAPMCS